MFYILNDQNSVVFIGDKSACYDYIISGDIYLQSAVYKLFTFGGDLIKTFTTKR